jgi:hypothetical protein
LAAFAAATEALGIRPARRYNTRYLIVVAARQSGNSRAAGSEVRGGRHGLWLQPREEYATSDFSCHTTRPPRLPRSLPPHRAFEFCFSESPVPVLAPFLPSRRAASNFKVHSHVASRKTARPPLLCCFSCLRLLGVLVVSGLVACFSLALAIRYWVLCVSCP